MSVRIKNISNDCLDPARLATFWADALSWRITSVETDEVVLEPQARSPADGIVPDIVFLLVPEDRASKNRLHIDLRPSDQFAEVHDWLVSALRTSTTCIPRTARGRPGRSRR
jgi:hypothetical protein